jgi:hypothetical protein
MESSSLPTNSFLQNTPRYQFSLKSETINNLSILLATVLETELIGNDENCIQGHFYFQRSAKFQCSLISFKIDMSIRSQLFLVRIFYQPYLIYMPSLVEIPLAVSDISEVKDFDFYFQIDHRQNRKKIQCSLISLKIDI